MAASKKLQEPLHSSPINVLGESRISKRRTTQPTGMSDRDYTSPVINEVTSADERTNDVVRYESDHHSYPAVRGDPHQIIRLKILKSIWNRNLYLSLKT